MSTSFLRVKIEYGFAFIRKEKIKKFSYMRHQGKDPMEATVFIDEEPYTRVSSSEEAEKVIKDLIEKFDGEIVDE